MTDNIVREFNNELMEIINLVMSKDRNNHNLMEIQDKFRIGRREIGEEIVRMAGPHIWTHRKQIKERDENFFLTAQFDTDPNAAVNVGEVIEQLRNMYSNFIETELDIIWKHVKKLLKLYAKYLKSMRR